MDIGMHGGLVTRTVRYHGDVCIRSTLPPDYYIGWDCGEEVKITSIPGMGLW